jgi:hypothetical protein
MVTNFLLFLELQVTQCKDKENRGTSINTSIRRKKSIKKYNFKAVDFFVFLYDTLGALEGMATMISWCVKS